MEGVLAAVPHRTRLPEHNAFGRTGFPFTSQEYADPASVDYSNVEVPNALLAPDHTFTCFAFPTYTEDDCRQIGASAAQGDPGVYAVMAGEEVTRMPRASREEKMLAGLVAEAREAQAAWAKVPVKRRAVYVRAMRDRIAARADGICELIMRATGKTRVDAMSTEVLPLALAASWYAKTAPRVMRSRRIRGGHPFFFFKSSRIERVPWGVVGIISPWNYPFGIPLHDVMTALRGRQRGHPEAGDA